MTNSKILFLPLYNDDWASSKYRVYKHIPHLKKRGLICTVLHPPRPYLLPRLRYYVKLLIQCFTSDVIVIQKKIFRLPLFKMIMLSRKKIVFDFDDAIYSFDQDRQMINYVLSRVHHIIAADEALAVYARAYNSHISILPTPGEDHCSVENNPNPNKTVRIVWVGRQWNQHYLAILNDVFDQIKKFPINFILYVVSGSPFHFEGKDFPIVNIMWSEQAEEKALRSADIGIVPLTDDEWSRGKCAYKVLLYMSYKIPVIASPVGVKGVLIKHGVNGMLASTNQEWINCIQTLSSDRDFRRRIGDAGYEIFLKDYTYDVISARYADILRTL